MKEMSLYTILVEGLLDPIVSAGLAINVSILMMFLLGYFLVNGEIDYPHLMRANKYVRETTLLSILFAIVKIFIIIA